MTDVFDGFDNNSSGNWLAKAIKAASVERCPVTFLFSPGIELVALGSAVHRGAEWDVTEFNNRNSGRLGDFGKYLAEL